MKTVLIISSFVSASHVGAGNSAFCLQRLGIETAILPTTLFGRHPGWGMPGGMITSPELLKDIWGGVNAQDLAFDGIMTGYMGHIKHVELAAKIINTLRRSNPLLTVLVDPVMGDHDKGDTGRLYVKELIANAVIETLLPLADITTPNLWELEYITGQKPRDLNSVRQLALQALNCDNLITSVPHCEAIGVMWNTKDKSTYTSHNKFKTVPNGGGDALAGTFLAHRLNGLSGERALLQSTSSIFEIMKAANSDDLGELPLIRKQNALLSPPALKTWNYPYDL